MKSGQGASNGLGKEPFDRWFRYPAGFSSDCLDACYSATQLEEGQLLVDPFAGAGTTGVWAERRRIDFVGIEAHPLVAELASTKFQAVGSRDNIETSAMHVLSGLSPCSIENEHSLVKRCFDEQVLEKLVAIRTEIQRFEDGPSKAHLKWCLLGILRDAASVRTGWPYQRPNTKRKPRCVDTAQCFLRLARWMDEDLTLAPPSGRSTIYNGDSRAFDTWEEALEGKLADGVITSPPYLNNFDYADATRLELYFWGMARNWREMTNVARSGMVIATTQQSRKSPASEAMTFLSASCPRTAEVVDSFRRELAAERKKRGRGKEYDLLVPCYFGDLVKFLFNVRNSTKPGAPVVLVLGDSAPYGVHVDTPEILASTAAELGFEKVATQTLRLRGQRWPSNGVRHSKPLLEKMVVLRSPGYL